MIALAVDGDDTERLKALEAAAMVNDGMPLLEAVRLTGADPRAAVRRLGFAELPYTPTPEEIAERAAEVRETWTPAERARRLAGGVAGPLSIPTVRIREIMPQTA